MSDVRIEPISEPKCIAPSCDRNATHAVFEGPNYCGNFCEPHAAEKVKILAEYAERLAERVAEHQQREAKKLAAMSPEDRTPACDKHLSRNDEHECPWCKLETRETELADLEQEAARLRSELDRYRNGRP